MRRTLAITAVLVLGSVSMALAQARPEEKPKSFVDELNLFAYVENSYVANLHGTGRHDQNELRLYDLDGGWSFNMAELSIKKDPSDRYPFGFGVVVTGGTDARKNHALGIFRDDDDVFPFDDTVPIDLEEAYASYKIPIGSGLTVKAGKFVTLLGYEVIESPNNLNFSRSFMFGFAIPLTHVGILASYAFGDWLSVTAGPVVGWDVADDNNDYPSWMGQFASTPVKDLSLALNWITGPEQTDNTSHYRTVFDLTATYTGIKKLTLGANVDYGFEQDEPSLVALGTRKSNDASWWGLAGYVAYDWLPPLRTALRVEYFRDEDGVRTAARGAGREVSLWETTATVQYKVWKGLVARLEYRHDQAVEGKVFKLTPATSTPTRRSQDTISLDLYYSFF